MKNKSLKFLGVVLVIALVATLFCACDFLNFLNDIGKVEITVGSGLIKVGDGDYTAYACSDFHLTASWDNKRVGNPDIDWHTVDESGNDLVGAYHGKDYGYAYALADVGKTYTYYAKIGGVKSNEIKISVVEAEVSDPTISCMTHTLSNGIVQQKISSGLTDVVLSASWNENELAEDRNIEVYWLVDGVVQAGEKSKIFTYKVDDISDECSVVVKVMLFEDGIEKTSAQVILSFVNRFDMVDSVKLRVADDVKTIGNAYYVTRNSGVNGNESVTLKSSILPLGANQSADCTYNITTSLGTTQKAGALLESIPLSCGKNVISATVQNVESQSIIVYCLDYAYDAIPADIKTAIESTFFWSGNMHDRYISTQADLNAFMGYAVAEHLTDADFNIYLADQSFRSQDALKQMLSTAVAQGVDESGSFAYSFNISDAMCTIKFVKGSRFGEASGACERVTETKQINSYVRYKEVNEKRTSLPIDSAEREMSVTNSNDLYRVVAAGYKPVFSNTDSGVKLAQLYQKARDVLTTYISDDMSELEKVAAIYDWIVCEVDYDYDAAYSDSKDSRNYNAFYLEGVFGDNRAVCDGKSKAFALLCGIEGIKCVRVCGYADKNISDYAQDDLEKLGFGHAWNKVLVDVDGDGIREWYAVDTTWGDSGVDSGKVKYEYLNYAFFLKTDEEMSSTHIEKTIAPKTTSQKYNVYKNTYIEISGKRVSLYIDSVETADTLLRYSSVNGKLALSVCDENNILSGAHIGYSYVKCTDGQYVIYALK